jgi:DNA primase large subunit
MLTDKSDLAKYPFTVEAARYVSDKDLKIQDLVADVSFEPVLDRAKKRIEETIISAKVSEGLQNNPDWEILSFPTAIMLLSIIGDQRLIRRYALAESKRAYELLKKDPPANIIEIAKNTFGWKMRQGKTIEESYYEYALHFMNYLRNATSIHEPEWKLTNRILSRGYVYLTKDETSRLLLEEIQRKILDRSKRTTLEIPSALAPRAEKIREMIEARKGFMRIEEAPRAAVYTAMPPCIRNLYDALFAGRNLSHMGRFTLTSFLVNVGVSEEDIVKTFKAATDFDEKKTRYQVEHIAGRRGGKRKYTPPRCETLKTHGVCVNPDNLCKQIKHPLSYYRRKVGSLFKRGKKPETG